MLHCMQQEVGSTGQENWNLPRLAGAFKTHCLLVAPTVHREDDTVSASTITFITVPLKHTSARITRYPASMNRESTQPAWIVNPFSIHARSAWIRTSVSMIGRIRSQLKPLENAPRVYERQRRDSRFIISIRLSCRVGQSCRSSWNRTMRWWLLTS